MKKKWKVAIIGFDHMHAGDWLRLIVESERAELAGIYDSDPARLAGVANDFNVDEALRFTDAGPLIDSGELDIAVICSTTAEHPMWTDRLARAGVNVIVEKPFATTLAEADQMIASAAKGHVNLAVNWPLAWYPPHRTTERLIREGFIGDVREVHYYDGNRGPLWHLHDKKEANGAIDPEAKRATWWYQAARGGGSLLDYLGYGVTLGTWFRGGELPSAITASVHVAPGDEVDEQSVVVAEFPGGLSTFQTRWGTFTDPWTHQPQPKCGFVVVGTKGTIATYDYEDHVTAQTADHPEGIAIPVDDLEACDRDGLANMIAALDAGTDVTGPVSPWISRAGQRIVDSAREALRQRTTVELAGSSDEALKAAVAA